jgi:2-polyprenyl-3-methyl-5-hydroxy-6-metoxy-1,4-benzoquinol methylase
MKQGKINTGTINTFIHQKVNAYLCFALLGLMILWVILYYGTHNASTFVNNYNQSASSLYSQVGN